MNIVVDSFFGALLAIYAHGSCCATMKTKDTVERVYHSGRAQTACDLVYWCMPQHYAKFFGDKIQQQVKDKALAGASEDELQEYIEQQIKVFSKIPRRGR